MALKPVQEDLSFLQSRFVYVIIAASIFFGIVLARLYYLQILHGDEYRTFAHETTLKEIRLPAVRGSLLDRNGVPIVSNRPAFDLALVPQYVRDFPRLSSSLQELIELSPEQIQTAWSKSEELPSFYPVTISRDIGYDAMARVRVRQAISADSSDYELQGVEVQAQSVRRYPHSSMAAATLGYVREASRSELDRLQASVPGVYHLGDRVGVSGLERRWETLLNGRDGYQQKIVNAVGREVPPEELMTPLAREPARSGSSIVTTLDHRLQSYAESLFADKTGALVALNPQNGEIYALVSQPSFDLVQLASRMSAPEWARLTQDPGKVFLNRPIQAAYPPGSTYKIVTAAAALEEGVVTPNETVYCPGYLRFGRRSFRCWKRGGHGRVDLHRALVQSCDVYFYTMGLRLGVDRLARYAQLLGLGAASRIDLSGEAAGLIPTAAWKERTRRVPWIEGETLSIAIGQGYDLVTPVQNAVMIAAVANGGRVVTPHIARHFIDQEGQAYPIPGRHLTQAASLKQLSDQTIRLLQRALAGVVAEPGGTAGRLKAHSVPIAGKTGTSQVIGQKVASQKKEYKDHAWFVAYAPVESPEIAVSVLVEHGGHGSSVAAPIAGALIEKFMELKGADGGQPQPANAVSNSD